MNESIIILIGYYASMYGIDPMLALSVAKVESNLNPAIIGSKGEVGLFQLMPSNVPHLSKKQLHIPKINIREGIKQLAWNKKYCKHAGKYEYLTCFNYGIKNAQKVKHPKLFPYYKKVMNEMDKLSKDQKVIVLLMHGMVTDGEGTYLGESNDYHFKGYHRILNEYGQVMLIERDRIVGYEEYWKKKKQGE